MFKGRNIEEEQEKKSLFFNHFNYQEKKNEQALEFVN